MSQDSLTITDNRTGKTYEVPVTDDTIRALDLRKIKVNADDFGLMTHDPGFTNTSACRSAITFIDGDKGILRYRGYPIEQLADQSTYLETAYLILNGELPSNDELNAWVYNITHRTMVHENIKQLMDGYQYDAHPMGMLISTIAALSTFYPGAKQISDPAVRHLQIARLIAKMPTIAAYAYRKRMGLPYIYPDNSLSYTGNFLKMMFQRADPYVVNPILEKTLDVLFILHADHEQNCGTNAMRSVGSSKVDPYSAMAAAAAALYGPLHGGANEEVIHMLGQIEHKDNVPAFVERVKKREVLLMGFGHRVYKNYDPRAAIVKQLADQVFEVTGRNPMLDIALELERIALEDDFFVSRKLYPNVDFYTGIIYQAMKFPLDMFPVLFAIPRTVGWLAQWQEMTIDPETAIARPREIYT
ncbi:MAG: citrate synthase, partial [Herpetosiphonaceae bacterium]|nr:citrate synthase [Herpetosiphonaceae bacterium]